MMAPPNTPTDRDAAQARVQLTLDNLLTYARLLQDALVRYGGHKVGCPVTEYRVADCTCGFDATLVGLIPRERREGR